MTTRHRSQFPQREVENPLRIVTAIVQAACSTPKKPFQVNIYISLNDMGICKTNRCLTAQAHDGLALLAEDQPIKDNS